MKTESTALYVLKLGLILLAITAVVAALLGGVNLITKDRIAAINDEKVAAAIAQVLESDAQPDELELPGEYPEITNVYKMGDDGYAVELEVSGSQGTIDMMTGVKPDGEITGVSIVSHSETAGLGAVYAGDTDAGVAFRESFVGKSGTVSPADVDYKSGATISADAICSGASVASQYVASLG